MSEGGRMNGGIWEISELEGTSEARKEEMVL